MSTPNPNPTALEAKICVLGAQGTPLTPRPFPTPSLHLPKAPSLTITLCSLIGVGKTSLIHRYLSSTPPSRLGPAPTIGASFLTKRTVDIDTGTTVRLQLWDTAGQERFHSITKLYYRGASAILLCYSIVDEKSFEEMGRWLKEVRRELGEEVVLHVVGMKADVAEREPSRREVAFERCIAYVAENLYSAGGGEASAGSNTSGGQAAAANATGGRPMSVGSLGGILGRTQSQRGRGKGGKGQGHSRSRSRGSSDLLDSGIGGSGSASGVGGGGGGNAASRRRGTAEPGSKRPSSGLWGTDAGWDVCHEISAESGEGVEEVFRVITRKLVEKSLGKKNGSSGDGRENARPAGANPYGAAVSPQGAADGNAVGGYFDRAVGAGSGNGGSFRLRPANDKRRSWLLGFPTPSVGGEEPEAVGGAEFGGARKKGGGCC